jgi:Calcium binding
MVSNIYRVLLMSRIKLEPDREERIDMEIVVDAYTPEEQAMGWYYYLADKINFPFQAKYSSRSGEIVEVVDMAEEEECETNMLVQIRYRERNTEDVFTVPLTNVEPLEADAPTLEAIADWHYFLERGYQLEGDDE